MKFLYWLIQLTWGFLQTLLGFFVYLKNITCRHSLYKGCVVTEWNKTSGLSLGPFVFVPKHEYLHDCELCRKSKRVLVHEYGHTLQSLLLGPLYLFVIGIPSLSWASLPKLRKMRKERHISYYSFYTEKWADSLAEKFTDFKFDNNRFS